MTPAKLPGQPVIGGPSPSRFHVQVSNGTYVNPLDLRPADVSIEVIAHALSNICRFNGHTSKFYSVAEHSLLVAGVLESKGFHARTILAGLLHDASEAYLGDIVRPLKLTPLFETYLSLEAFTERVIFKQLIPNHTAADWTAVRMADDCLLANEAIQLMNAEPRIWSLALPDTHVDLDPSYTPAPHEIKRDFLQRYTDLHSELI